MMAASGTARTVAEPGRGEGTVWHTLRVRGKLLTALAVAAAGGTLASAAPARTAASARASAAVGSGTLGRVGQVKASGDDGTSRSAPSTTPDGIELGGGSVSVFSTRTGQASAQAEAQARDVVLLGGAVSATLVRRTATDTGAGVRYGGTVSGLHVDGQLVTGVRAGRHYPLSGGAAPPGPVRPRGGGRAATPPPRGGGARGGGGRREGGGGQAPRAREPPPPRARTWSWPTSRRPPRGARAPPRRPPARRGPRRR